MTELPGGLHEELLRRHTGIGEVDAGVAIIQQGSLRGPVGSYHLTVKMFDNTVQLGTGVQ